MDLQIENFIAGESSSGERVEVKSEYYDGLSFSIPVSGEGDLQRALQATEEARGLLKSLPWEEREEMIRKALRSLDLQEENRLTTQMTGYPIRLLRRSWDRFRENYLLFLDSEVADMGPLRSPLPEGMLERRWKPRPLAFLLLPDNVEIITPWTVFTAALTGCPLLLKPGSTLPWTPLRILEALLEAGYPPQALNLLFLRGPSGASLLRKAISETLNREGTFIGFGSNSTLQHLLGGGTPLAAEALQRGRFFFFGSGGSRCVVTRSADLETAAEALIDSLLLPPSSCLSPKVCYVEAEVFEEFSDLLSGRIGELRVGDPLEERTEIGFVESRALEEGDRLIRYTEAFGAERLRGRRIGAHQMEPYLLKGIPEDFDLLERENYPLYLLSLVPYSSRKELLRRSGKSGKSLVTSLFTRDPWEGVGAEEWKTYHLHINRGTQTSLFTGHQGTDLWRLFLEEWRVLLP
jgi:acyl-CoA reductase-like NAD-dependent aldehyde dehydrogenase